MLEYCFLMLKPYARIYKISEEIKGEGFSEAAFNWLFLHNCYWSIWE